MAKILDNKKLLKFVQYTVSAILLYVVFKRMNLREVIFQIANVPPWYIFFCVFFWLFSNYMVCYRWSSLLLEKSKFSDVVFFMKSVLMSNFYALFLPSSMSTDLIKWIPIKKKYPDLSKADLVGSVFLDRVTGLTAFVCVAFGAIIVGRLINVDFPIFVFWLFLAGFVALLIFYLCFFFLKMDFYIEKIKFLPRKIKRLMLVFFRFDKKKVIRGLALSFLVTPLWSIAGWMGFVAFKTGIPLLTTMILMPVVSLLLILPISAAGFGAREGLFVYFFGQLAVSNESVLASSAFSGILSLVFSLIGGILTLL